MMGAFLVKRLGFAIVTLWAVLTLVFIVVRIVPGDPAQVILGDQADAAAIWALRDDVMQTARWGPPYTFDVSLPIADMPAYVERVRAELCAAWPAVRCTHRPRRWMRPRPPTQPRAFASVPCRPPARPLSIGW
mgnify:CR=1 FL=1